MNRINAPAFGTGVASKPRGARALRSALVLLPLFGCTSSPPNSTPVLWSADRIQAAARVGQFVGGRPATDWVTLRQQPIPLLSPPYTASPAPQKADSDGFNVFAAFSEGRPAAYAVVEVWENIPEIWQQPWYVQVTAYDPTNPFSKHVSNAPAIVDLSASSWFYSSFWELTYAVVPPAATGDTYHSAKQLFDDRLEIHRSGAGLLAPLVPSDLAPATVQGSPPVRPFSGDVVGNTGPSSPVWLNGTQYPSLIFASNFTWSDSSVINEAALFIFAKSSPSGELVPFGLPAVIGTGPVGTNRPARVTAGGAPQFGSLTRPHLTVLAPSAAVFIPSSQPTLQSYFRSLGGISVPPVNATIEQRADVKDYLLRVVLNPSCFTDPTQFPTNCRWLDSQSAIETNISSGNIVPQSVLLTSPVLFYNGQRVGR